MPRQSSTYRTVWTVAGVIAAVALAVRGITSLGEGVGVPLILVAVAIVAALLLRHTRYRD